MEQIEGPEFIWNGEFKVTGAATQTSTSHRISSREMAPDLTREKIFGKNNLRAISILEQMTESARPVVHINIPGKGVATGFMIKPDILLTNNHVFESADDARKAIIRFNYQLDLSGNFVVFEEYQTDASVFHTNPGLDYSVVKIVGSPGNKWGFLELPIDSSVEVQDDVFIIQHPGGQHKQITLSDNVVAYVDDTVIQYLTDTLPGSSGAPVFNDSTIPVALHHSGGWIPEPSTKDSYFRNEGIRLTAIAKDLPSAFR